MRPDPFKVSPEGEFTGKATEPLSGTFTDLLKDPTKLVQGLADYFSGVDLEMDRGERAIQGTVPAIRAAQDKAIERAEAVPGRPEVPAGQNPFENADYLAWRETLNVQQRKDEDTRLRRERRRPATPPASAPPDPSKPPPTVG